MDIAIQALELKKVFAGGKVAVNALNLTVPRGAVYGLIGRNGAGKTTALRMLMGLLRPSSGSALVLGQDLWKASREFRARIAYVSQVQQLPQWMTTAELCYYVAHFYEGWDAQYARDLAKRFEVPWEQQVGLMSGGEQRKAAILLGFAACSEVLILDEPAAGLDPIARRQLIDEIVELLSRESRAHTILFSTHIIADLERVADQIGIMDRGHMVMEEPLETLQESFKRVQVIFNGDTPPAGFNIPNSLQSNVSGPIVSALVRVSDPHQLDEFQQIPGARVNVFPMNLEETVIQLLGRRDDEDGAASETTPAEKMELTS